MIQPIFNYRSLVFDCDGVILDSNRVKTNAFYKATLPYGEPAAQAMVDYHIANGGISRYIKFSYFIDQLVPEYASGVVGPNLDALLISYASHVRKGLLNCDVTPSLDMLRQRTSNTRWLIVSGGDQAELRDIFSLRGISKLFDGGIFGSPDTKDEIIKREISNHNIEKPALFLGDSKYDYQAAMVAGIDFVFLSAWSEVREWQNWVKKNGIACKRKIKDLFDD